MNKRKFQSGSAQLIAIILLVIALIGTLGFVYYQNFIQDKDGVSKIDDTKKIDEVEATAPAIAPSVVINGFLTSYFEYMNSTERDGTEADFAAQSSALADDFKNSITAPNQGQFSSPIILAQDMPPSPEFTVGTETINGDNATVSVTLNFSPKSVITYSLVIVNNEWKIDGVNQG